MNLSKIIGSKEIELNQLLKYRDDRYEYIKELIKDFKKTLIVFSLNIVGPKKMFNLSINTFYEGLSIIKDELTNNNINIIFERTIKDLCGYESFIVVDHNCYDLKKITTKIEDGNTLGRLFDIDIINFQGEKISREDINEKGRSCIICNNPVFICSRSRKHSVEEILKKEISIMLNYFIKKNALKLSEIAYDSLILEVKTTPKPGLVDLNNNGSHNDMNLQLFEKSSKAIKPFFSKFFLLGCANYDKPICLIFNELRELGIKCEREMFKATDGVNTHKGVIFIFSLTLCSLGWLYLNNSYSRDNLKNTIKELSKDILNDFIDIDLKKELTNGQIIFRKYEKYGIRGEAKNGFSSVLDYSINKFNNYLEKGYSLNDSGVFTLIHIFLIIDDTNVISRSNIEALNEIKKFINNNLDKIEDINFISNLDVFFINHNLSAGGSADLLSLTYFISYFESEWLKNFNLIKS